MGKKLECNDVFGSGTALWVGKWGLGGILNELHLLCKEWYLLIHFFMSMSVLSFFPTKSKKSVMTMAYSELQFSFTYKAARFPAV